MWVTDQDAAGAVIGSHTAPHSNIVDGPHGQNHYHLISSQTDGTPKEQPLGDVPEQTSVEPPKPNIPAVPSTHRTRSGRVVVRPTYGLIS